MLPSARTVARGAAPATAERQNAYLAGGFAEGWEAPALTSLSKAPIPWNEDELYAYLRTGESRFHGVAFTAQDEDAAEEIGRILGIAFYNQHRVARPAKPSKFGALVDKGYSEPDIEKILGGNILRVMEQVERVAHDSATFPTQK